MKSKLLNPEQWHGVWTAVITPLLSDSHGNKALDEESFKQLLNKQIEDGIHGFVIAGSTGEGSLLGFDLYKTVLQSAQKIIQSRVPLVAGIGIGGTQSSLTHLKVAKDLGYDGVLAAPPAYVKAPQRGLINHYLRLAQEEIPICIYEVPGRAASSIQVDTLEQLIYSKTPQAKYLVATKDASNDLERAKKENSVFAGRMALLSGEDGSFDEFRKLGGHGLISVASHLIPSVLINVFENFATLSDDNRQLIDALFWESNPIPVKTLLAKVGLIRSAVFSEPLCPMKDELLHKLEAIYFRHTS